MSWQDKCYQKIDIRVVWFALLKLRESPEAYAKFERLSDDAKVEMTKNVIQDTMVKFPGFFEKKLGVTKVFVADED